MAIAKPSDEVASRKEIVVLEKAEVGTKVMAARLLASSHHWTR